MKLYQKMKKKNKKKIAGIIENEQIKNDIQRVSEKLKKENKKI